MVSDLLVLNVGNGWEWGNDPIHSYLHNHPVPPVPALSTSEVKFFIVNQFWLL